MQIQMASRNAEGPSHIADQRVRNPIWEIFIKVFLFNTLRSARKRVAWQLNKSIYCNFIQKSFPTIQGMVRNGFHATLEKHVYYRVFSSLPTSYPTDYYYCCFRGYFEKILCGEIYRTKIFIARQIAFPSAAQSSVQLAPPSCAPSHIIYTGEQPTQWRDGGQNKKHFCYRFATQTGSPCLASSASFLTCVFNWKRLSFDCFYRKQYSECEDCSSS